MTSIKKEGSVVANIKGFQQGGPGGLVHKKHDKDRDKPFVDQIGDPITDPELFEMLVAKLEVTSKKFSETVRKRGEKFVIYDDDTNVAKGSYDDRDTAWEHQRIMRRSEKNKKKSEKKEDKKQESLQSYIRNLLIKEGSMVSYVFENTPMSDESLTWENFINKLSKQTVLSDPKLNKILHFIAKSEINSLKKSANTVREILEGSGHFTVQIAGKIEKDPATGDPKIDFVVFMRDNNKKLKFSIKLDNSRPLFMWEDSKEALDQMANEESKLLRAELIHIQETTFKQMQDVSSAIEKRDKYLKALEQKFDKLLNSITPLEMSMVKYLLRDKYKSVR